MASELWKVLSNSDPSRIRTLFQGLEKDARAFIESHYPRAHVEPPNQDPGVPDVKLVSPDGAEDTYHAEDGWASANQSQDVLSADDDEDGWASANQSQDVLSADDDDKPVSPGFTKPGQKPGQKPSSPELA
jgi:hypothetical protein